MSYKDVTYNIQKKESHNFESGGKRVIISICIVHLRNENMAHQRTIGFNRVLTMVGGRYMKSEENKQKVITSSCSAERPLPSGPRAAAG